MRALVVPPATPIVVALVGLLMLRWRPRLGRALLWIGLLGAWALSSFVVAERLMRLAEAGQTPLDAPTWQAARDGPRPPGAVVILGAGAVGDGPFEPRRERLNARSLQRVVAGARVARMTGLPVLVSGGRPNWLLRSEAELMREVLRLDLATDVRWTEIESRDTAENAARSAAILRSAGIDSVVLVTHAYHMDRSRAAFEAVGLKVLPAPHDWWSGRGDSAPTMADLLPSAGSAEITWLALHELIGKAWYRLASGE